MKNSPEREYAGFWIRVAADLIDSSIMNVATLLLGGLMFGSLYGMALLVGPDSPFGARITSLFTPFGYQVAFVFLRVGLSFLYYTWGHFCYATTLGKALLRLKVVAAASYGPISLTQSVLRSLNYFISYLPVGGGFLMVGLHPKKQAFHDLLAETIVLRSPKPR